MKVDADIVPLLDVLKKKGYKLKPSGKHPKLIDSKGRVVQDPTSGKPIIFASSSSEHRNREQLATRLVRSGIIKAEENPWRPQKPKESDPEQNGGIDPEDERKKARLAALAEASKEREKATTTLRARIEPLIVVLGGWAGEGFQSQFGKVAFHYLRSQNHLEGWPSESAAIQSTRNLRLGNTLSATAQAAWDVFTRELEDAAGISDDHLRDWYFDRVRELKGLRPPRREFELGEKVDVAGLPWGGRIIGKPADEPKLEEEVVAEESLAMEVMLRMAQGVQSPDFERIREIGALIHELERKE